MNQKKIFTIASLCRSSVSVASLNNKSKEVFPDNTEYILLDNSKNEWDCYRAISKFLTDAHGDYVVICHDDIDFGTLDFSRILNQINMILKTDPLASVFGIAGVSSEDHSLIGHFFDSEDERLWGFGQGTKASSLDEVFLIVRNGLGITVSDHLKGYHFYGTDLCLNAMQNGFSCHVIDFPILHISSGSLNENFFQARDNYEKHLRERNLSSIVRTTCTYLYGGGNPLKDAWTLCKSLDLLDQANHPDLLESNRCILQRGYKRHGKALFSIINKLFHSIKYFRERLVSDILWWIKFWKNRLTIN
jgi:hypothetical protein